MRSNLFENINDLSTSQRKQSFIEKVTILIRIIQCFAEAHSLKIAQFKKNSSIENELFSIGIISTTKDEQILQKILGKDKFNTLINCIGFEIQNKEELQPLLLKISNEYRRKAIEHESTQRKPTIADFFCGAGGLSLGFIQSGYKVMIANDIEDVCFQSYTYNHPELPIDNFILGDIRLVLDNMPTQEVDIVVGGPPCQGFSSANRQRIIDDPRNKLYKYFIEAICKFKPKVVVMENVKGMLSVADQVVEDYNNITVDIQGQSLSYNVSYRLLNSVNFSVAQSRERLIYIAIRNDIEQRFEITPEKIFSLIEHAASGKPHFVLRDALEYISPLDAPRVKNMTEVDDEKTGKKITVNTFERQSNDYLTLINNGQEQPLLFNHKARFLNDINYQIFSILRQGEDASNEKIKGIMPYAHRLHCFKDKYYRLIEDKPSRTITAHLKMDCLSHIHPTQTRSITPREAARIQSFPDDYMFLGAYLKTYMQIGNAVPPLMARAIAEIIKPYVI